MPGAAPEGAKSLEVAIDRAGADVAATVVALLMGDTCPLLWLGKLGAGRRVRRSSSPTIPLAFSLTDRPTAW